jgi:hypothetical protein
VIPVTQSVQDLVSKARSGTLAANDPDYQTLVRQSNQGVQDAKNALDLISDAGGARKDVSVNKVV